VPVRINAQIDAFRAERSLDLVAADFEQAVARLASGLRIRGAADDPAGLGASQTLRAQSNGFEQAGRNAQDAISLLQAGDIGLAGIQAALQRLRVLAIQAASDTLTLHDRANIQTEAAALVRHIDLLAQQTDVNGKRVLDGSLGGQISGGGPDITAIVAQAGAVRAGIYRLTGAQNATRAVWTSNAPPNGSFFTTTSSITIQGGLGTETFTAVPGESLEDFFQQVNNSPIGVTMQIDTVNNPGYVLIVNKNYGSYDPTLNPEGPQAVNVLSATGDFDTSGLAMDFTFGFADNIDLRGQMLGGAALNATIRILNPGGSSQILTGRGANSEHIIGSGQTSGISFTLVDPGFIVNGNTFLIVSSDGFVVTQNPNVRFHVGANADQAISFAQDALNSQALGVNALDFLTPSGAETAITRLDEALQSVSATRANVGAVLNRLTNALVESAAAGAGTTTAQSRLVDADVASEAVRWMRDQILLQSGTSVLAQVNQQNREALIRLF